MELNEKHSRLVPPKVTARHGLADVGAASPLLDRRRWLRDQENAASATETAQTGWLFQSNVLSNHPGASRHPSCPGGAMPPNVGPSSTLLVNRNDRLVDQIRDSARHILLTFALFLPPVVPRSFPPRRLAFRSPESPASCRPPSAFFSGVPNRQTRPERDPWRWRL